MSDWKISGKPDGVLPEAGKTYAVIHSRKGRFNVLAKEVNGEWLTGEIVDGTAKAALRENVRFAGEETTIRDSHSLLIEIEVVS